MYEEGERGDRGNRGDRRDGVEWGRREEGEGRGGEDTMDEGGGTGVILSPPPPSPPSLTNPLPRFSVSTVSF